MRRLIALAAVTAAAVAALASPASAGCAEDYLIRADPPRRYVLVSATGPSVYVDDEGIVSDVNREIRYTTTFVDCVV